MKKAWESWKDEKGNVYCLESGKKIPFHPRHVAHVISKGSFPGLRKDIRNMIPLCAQAHDQFDNGKGRLTRKDMKIWPMIEARIERLKREYTVAMNSPEWAEIKSKLEETGILEVLGLEFE